ncbi:tetratricopeptide repeat protein [Pseudomonas cavernae]|uniref:Tetratricopeptide repeat protein n=1 Tax=Pseudomonas cavernae TaxID=2320867 RepID=A0A385Z7T2_9PSED|nr:tetratricopeptide repeat protein [Pseudomonas cavernae]AYC34117.1 tetratricopeptide repeat protein [Pseudomonas cavernae]
MRILLLLTLALSAVGCARWSMDYHLNNAYREYGRGNCERVMLELSQVERKSRSRGYIQPEVSLLRGQCLERQNLFVDAAQTYQFIIARYPSSEYAYRARARLDTLRQLGRIDRAEAARTSPATL